MTTYIITKRLSLSFGNCKTFDPERAPCSIVTQLNKLNNNRTLAEFSNRLLIIIHHTIIIKPCISIQHLRINHISIIAS